MRHITGLLFDIGFTRFASETCAFYRTFRGQSITLLVYVDDILAMYNSDEMYNDFITKLRSKIEVKTEELNKFLGCTITIDDERGTIKMDNRILIEKMLDTLREDVTKILLRNELRIAPPQQKLPDLPDFLTGHIDPLTGIDDSNDGDGSAGKAAMFGSLAGSPWKIHTRSDSIRARL